MNIQAAIAQANNIKGSSQEILQEFSPGLPSELIHWILVLVLADSVHKISTSDLDVSWEMNAVSTLSAVSSRFRAITLDLATTTFDIKEDESVIDIVRSLLGQVRKAGLDLRGCYRDLRCGVETTVPTYLVSRDVTIQLGSGLVDAYMMWMSCQVLRCRIIGIRNAQAQSLEMHQDLLNLNSIALETLALVRPMEVTVHALEVLQLDKTLILMGMVLIPVRINILDAFRRLTHPVSDPDESLDSILIPMDKSLLIFEKVKGFSNDLDLASKHLIGDMFPEFHLAPVMRVLKRFVDVRMEFNPDKYNIRSRILEVYCTRHLWARRM